MKRKRKKVVPLTYKPRLISLIIGLSLLVLGCYGLIMAVESLETSGAPLAGK
jgi:hypothetical protein